MSEIKLRASIRMGEFVRELDRAEPGPVPEDTSQRREVIQKKDAIAQARLSTSTAHRLEQLTGGRDEMAQKAGKAAAEVYFAQSRADKKPASMDGLLVRQKTHCSDILTTSSRLAKNRDIFCGYFPPFGKIMFKDTKSIKLR